MAKYYYNGVLLPEIPAAELTEKPYLLIYEDTANSCYFLAASVTVWYYASGYIKGGGKYVATNYYSLPLDFSDADTWTTSGTKTGTQSISADNTVVWSNYDIPNGSATSTTIYFYGNSPVAVEPETPTERPRGYLIRSGSTLYTVTDGALSVLSEMEVTSSLFQAYGVDDLPDGALLMDLTDPEVLYWQDSEDELPVLELTVSGTPPVPQVVVTDAQDMSDGTILGIESVSIEASADVLWAMSFDDGANWKAYDGSQWVTLEQENSGMTAETFQNIPLEAWAEIVTSDAYRVRFVLMDTTSYVTNLVIHYLN